MTDLRRKILFLLCLMHQHLLVAYGKELSKQLTAFIDCFRYLIVFVPLGIQSYDFHKTSHTKLESLLCRYMFFYNHSVFQSEAQICLSFSQIQPQIMLKICLSNNIKKKTNFMIRPVPEGREVVKGIKMKKILKFVLSRLLKSLTQANNQGNQLIFTVNIQK